MNQYKIEIWNLLSPVAAEYMQKVLNEQIKYLEKKGLLENSRVMVSVENMNKKSVHVESNLITDLKN